MTAATLNRSDPPVVQNARQARTSSGHITFKEHERPETPPPTATLEKPAKRADNLDEITSKGSPAMPTAKPSITAAAAEVNEQKKRTDRHRPGYIRPDSDQKMIGFYLPEEMADALKLVVKNENTTVKDMLTAFVAEKIKAVLPDTTRQQLLEKEITRLRTRYGAPPRTRKTP